jgi:hypothetical protein
MGKAHNGPAWKSTSGTAGCLAVDEGGCLVVDEGECLVVDEGGCLVVDECGCLVVDECGCLVVDECGCLVPVVYYQVRLVAEQGKGLELYLWLPEVYRGMYSIGQMRCLVLVFGMSSVDQVVSQGCKPDGIDQEMYV